MSQGRSRRRVYYRRRMRAIRDMGALAAVVGVVCLLGCDPVPDNILGGSFPSTFRAAQPSDLQEQEFTFSCNAAFFGGRCHTVTLTFEDFAADGDGNPNTGPFTLATETSMASGIVTLGSCTFTFTTSDFPKNKGPQATDVVTMDPCEIDNEGHLHLLNTADSAVDTSAPAQPATP